MKRIFLLGAMLCSLYSAAQIKETPLIKIGDQTVSAEEFEFIYNKNNKAAQNPISKPEYLDLFINYKLKVAEAKALKLDTAAQYLSDCQDFYGELAQPFLMDTVSQQEAKDVIVKRMAEEIDASHILVRLDENPTTADTLAAYQRIDSARTKVLNGEKFMKVALQYSDDPSAQINYGRLGYFSTLQMVEPFEEAAYATKKGEVSQIFRTSYGYHFLMVHDRRHRLDDVRVAHIMKMFTRNTTAQQRAKMRATMDSIKTALDNGADFGELAKRCSDEKQTADMGGELPWVSLGLLSSNIKEFARQCDALKNDGDISDVFETEYGYHIVRRLERRNGYDVERAKESVEMAMMSGRCGPSLLHAGIYSLAKKLMMQHNFKWNKGVRDEVTGIFMNESNDGVRTLKLKNITQPLATFDTTKVWASDEYVARIWDTRNSPNENFRNIAASAMLSNLSRNLEYDNADFKYTVQEYRDGLLVFEINMKYIWDKNTNDSTLLAKLLAENPSRYAKGGTFDGTIYYCKDEKTANQVRTIAEKNPKKASKIADRVVVGKQEQGGKYDDYIWPNIESKYVVAVGTKTDGKPMTYSEAHNQLLSDYQQRLEMEYAEKLREKYRPVVLKK